MSYAILIALKNDIDLHYFFSAGKYMAKKSNHKDVLLGYAMYTRVTG